MPSPERIDPGNRHYSAHNIPKVGGRTDGTVYRAGLRAVQSSDAGGDACFHARAKEMTKLLENIFRSVNIAMVNELAVLMERMNIDIWEVIERGQNQAVRFHGRSHPVPASAATASRWIHITSPGRRSSISTPSSSSWRPKSTPTCPDHVVRKGCRRTQPGWQTGARLSGADLGVAFQARHRRCPQLAGAARVIELLLDAGAQIEYHDPFVPTFRTGGNALYRRPTTLRSVPFDRD